VGVETKSGKRVKEATGGMGASQINCALERGESKGRKKAREKIVGLVKDLPGELVLERMVEQTEEKVLQIVQSV